MSNEFSYDELLKFLDYAADRGLLPAATAKALAVASRNVLGNLEPAERADLRAVDLVDAAKRFSNRRAHDFTPDSLKEYERRVVRAVRHFLTWRKDPAGFRAATRVRRRTGRVVADPNTSEELPIPADGEPASESPGGTYRTAVPLGPGRIVTLLDVPDDLTRAEATRLVRFVELLAVDPKA